MKMPEGLREHQKDYREGAWREYTAEELQWWVRLLTKRAGHRTNPEKRDKDLHDAANYQAILDQEGYYNTNNPENGN